MEKEPKLRESGEAAEKKPKQAVPDTSQIRLGSEVTLPPLAEEAQEPTPEAGEVSVTFETLPQLVGKNILFRDPHARVNQTDDPYYKFGTIKKNGDRFFIVVIIGHYYPYYTNDRPSIFALNSQKDIDYYKISLE